LNHNGFPIAQIVPDYTRIVLLNEIKNNSLMYFTVTVSFAATISAKDKEKNLTNFARFSRASSRDRTNDLLITSQLLYQLSYGGL
jgi:hypothetical protein